MFGKHSEELILFTVDMVVPFIMAESLFARPEARFGFNFREKVIVSISPFKIGDIEKTGITPPFLAQLVDGSNLEFGSGTILQI